MLKRPRDYVKLTVFVLSAAWAIGYAVQVRQTPEIPLSDMTFFGLSPSEALLVVVTAWLVLVTRDLVAGADETAKRQLRAYVMMHSARIDNVQDG